MKKFIIVLLTVGITLVLIVFIILSVSEDRIVFAFKKQIIDKTSINMNFSEIHFSILKNFPYGSFILDDAQFFYSKEKNSDTLLASKKLSFKINTINLFRSIYEFPEIIISDGLINLKGDKIDLLFSEGSSQSQGSSYLETKKIKIKRCRVQYSYKEILKTNFYLDNSSCSGSFLSNTFSVKLNLNVKRIAGTIDDLKFKYNDEFYISATVKRKNNDYTTEHALLNIKGMPLPFSVVYSQKTNAFKVTLSGKNISAKDFCYVFLKNISVSKGSLSFNSQYSVNFNNVSSQKLSISYELSNIKVPENKSFCISTLKGKTTFTDNFNKNISEIYNFSIHHSGLDINGLAKVKNLPCPIILVDCQFQNTKDLNLSRNITATENFSGKLKSLVKLNDIYKLDINTLDIIKFNSEINFSNLIINDFPFINNLAGSIFINDNSFQFIGNGQLFSTPFKGTLSLSNFMDIIYSKALPSPIIKIDMERLNLDSILTSGYKNTDTASAIKFHLESNIKSLKYKGYTFNDLSFALKNSGNKYQCDHISMKAFSGTIAGKFDYSKQDGSNISFYAQNIDIKNVFKCFNNFGQSTITFNNLCGSLTGKIDLSFNQLNSGKINPMSIKLTSNLMVENGRLIGVSQLKRVSKFLNLDEVDSIQFKTLQNTIDIEQGLIKIPSMDVASNTLNFRLAGQHDFKGNFTYWVKLKLREILAKKYLLKQSYNSEYESDNNKGLNLFLKIHGNNDSFKVSFDKKSTVEHVKGNINQEGVLLKGIIKEEFNLSKNDNALVKDSAAFEQNKKVDTVHNKNTKKPFRIEWDEIDSTKLF